LKLESGVGGPLVLEAGGGNGPGAPPPPEQAQQAGASARASETAPPRAPSGTAAFVLPGVAPLFGPKAWSALAAFVAAVTIVVPVLFVAVPESSPVHLSAYSVTLIGKIMCYCVVALAMNLIWGYAGILSLGHGVFFALGGYAFGMHLMRMIGLEGQYQSDLPDFMVFLDWKQYPWYWSFTDHFWYAALLVVAVPAALAFVFGFFAFRSRIKGVYFSIITQALTFAFMLLFFRNDTGFGGNNGFTDFKRILGFRIADPGTRAALFALTGLYLAAVLVLSRAILRSKIGRVLTAIRDSENRLMFSGYNPLWYKLSVWTLSAVLCAIAGALYVPQVGIINPSEMSPANSIEIAIWVAVGGRGTLVGPVLGAALVNGAKSFFTQAFPEYWLYVLGLAFILVTLFMPHGLVGILRKWRTTT
jgi:urea transport system permease protein